MISHIIAPLIIATAALIAVIVRSAVRNRPHTITGIVKTGFNQGDKTGAKTANLDVTLAGALTPGLYSAKVILSGETHEGLLYYGINILSNEVCLEVHLLDFNQDIYGKKITVTTNAYLRRPKKFSSLEKLAAQIKKDLAQAKKL